MPHDPETVALLGRYGIPVVEAERADGPYDVVMDCAGILSYISLGNAWLVLELYRQHFYLL